ncbi:MAG: FKBP-type peptidyl-prolyl cis-trans isomerase [Cryobacterium sp.]|uniref:FKBP-type peptidyl-prolyl cis-trans isomerase n=1 Tax=unclassified Cryobacterium TaxID=2649013 RepID=UPI0018CA41BE|nr:MULTISPECIES: FKBP-type peptidyl-prolyl cis-trans isomerase [unclassified Cryobacterium]MCY7404358.1 FKBP-type peptidyl-prolyl cis-trans isomerase [Cryobacterium sp.]MEC5154651.1 FKBP-type peptidyl-prolyl cis-trans isomerase [Cryobacterium sp. CAN_C3]
MRKASALIVTAGLVMTALTACASPGISQASCDAPVTTGAASELVSASGNFGSAPDVTFPTPLKTTSTQRTEIISGSGTQAVAGQQLNVELNVYNGTTGKVIQQAAYDGKNFIPVVLNGAGVKGLTDGLLCAQVGERVAIVVAPEDAFGAAGNDQFGVAPTDSLVVVADVVTAFLPRANGVDQTVANGLPAVVLDENGVPGVVIPNGDAPTMLEVGVLKKGAGEKVTEGSTVTVNYSGILWKEKTVFDSSWANGSPVPLVAAVGSATQPGVIAGMSTALIGQTVGSQIVMVIPPSLGYGGAASAAIPADSTLIFVVDILGIN